MLGRDRIMMLYPTERVRKDCYIRQNIFHVHIRMVRISIKVAEIAPIIRREREP